jgi:N-methylhydantoinase B/oxoprolinase/acetone carboxylase alpha subunit
LPVGQGLYDMHGAGFGAAPYRDGVSTGGHMNNPSVGISDIENIEQQYPLVYFSAITSSTVAVSENVAAARGCSAPLWCTAPRI